MQERVLSPCVAVCHLETDSGLCRGCLRTGEEIAAWLYLSDEDRRVVLQNVERRRAERPA